MERYIKNIIALLLLEAPGWQSLLSYKTQWLCIRHFYASGSTFICTRIWNFRQGDKPHLDTGKTTAYCITIVRQKHHQCTTPLKVSITNITNKHQKAFINGLYAMDCLTQYTVIYYLTKKKKDSDYTLKNKSIHILCYFVLKCGIVQIY